MNHDGEFVFMCILATSCIFGEVFEYFSHCFHIVLSFLNILNISPLNGKYIFPLCGCSFHLISGKGEHVTNEKSIEA